ncbi:protein translocase subunit SecD [Nocardioides daejeonensis]|uniref:protein translocase subunit SecD n=1 Tax=Nocardioides daejeonensis TaxID=1046556 RepID=UPI000D741A9A|nr:protein translocase subunit SecD [Nocardioides daejeonensis]
MSRGAFVRLLLVLGLLAGCLWLSLEKKPTLGIDLKGGSQLMYQAQDPNNPDRDVTAAQVDKTIEVMRDRVDAIGVSEPTLVRVGTDRVLVELPDVQDPDQAKEVIGKTAQLSVHPVVAAAAGPDAKPSKEGNVIVPDEDGTSFLELGPSVISGNEIKSADAVQPQQSIGWSVQIEFDGKAGDAYQKITADAACFPTGDPQRRTAFVLDDKVISSPQAAENVQCNVGIGGGSTEITGNFTQRSAKDLALLIEAGALPLALGSFDDDGKFVNGVPMQDSVIGPTLGDAAIKASAEAAVIGVILTGLFIIIVYRLVGALAAVALTSYALLAYAMTVGVGATLTLPGLAGFVLAIGLAIDANVLVFERAREEYADNPKAGMRRALQIGFNKAWTAIIDSNVTTLLAALLLFLFASGTVKGFGVTLSIGVVASMISALVIARVLTEIGVSTKFIARRPAITGLSNVGRVRTWLMRKNPQIMKRSKIWLGAAGALTVFSLLGIFVHGMNLGLEFTGGRTLVYETTKVIKADDAREIVSDIGIPEAVVQNVKGSDGTERISIRAGKISDDERDQIENALDDKVGIEEKISDDTVAPSLGDELKRKAMIAFGIALIAQMLYLAFRFHWTFALSAVVSMFHDVLLVTGIYAWLDKPIDGVFLAAALTIVGLSANDTVVVFDRIRERWLGTKTGTFDEVSNTAILETMPRTVNTGLGAMFILAALVFMAGDSLTDFALALLLGLIIGTASTVFVASPMASFLQRFQAFPRDAKVKKVRDPEDSGAVV